MEGLEKALASHASYDPETLGGKYIQVRSHLAFFNLLWLISGLDRCKLFGKHARVSNDEGRGGDEWKK